VELAGGDQGGRGEGGEDGSDLHCFASRMWGSVKDRAGI
jgi:hypothetical protein